MGQWQKGKSPNPGGLSKWGKKLRELLILEAQKRCEGEDKSAAMWVAQRLMALHYHSKDDKVRLKALELFIDRTAGKMPVQLEIDGESEIRTVIITGVPDTAAEEPLIVVDKPEDEPNED